MPAFSGNTLVSLAGGQQIGIENDNKLPDSGALTWKHVNTPSDLAGTTGIDCKLVHGDRWQEIAGAMTEHFTGDVTSNVDGNVGHTVGMNETRNIALELTETVQGEATLNYSDRRTLNVYVKDEVNVYGSREVLITGLDEETYNVHREIDEPTKFETVFSETGWKTFILELCPLKVESCGLHVGVTVLNVEAEILEQTGKGICNRIGGLLAKIPCVTSTISAIDMKLATRINGAPTESVTAPIAGA